MGKGVNYQALLALIEPKLKELGMRADGASKKAGVPDAIRNIREHRGGTTRHTLGALAKVLQIPLERLQDAADSPFSEPMDAPEPLQKARTDLAALQCRAQEVAIEIERLSGVLDGIQRDIAKAEYAISLFASEPAKARKRKKR